MPATEPHTVRCASCGALNRVQQEQLDHGLSPLCGRCHAPLSAPAAADGSHPITVTDDTFADLVEASPVPVLLDLWAPWCGPCRMLAPVLDQVASELSGRIRIAKLDVDQNPRTAARFNARSIPLMVILDGGRERDRLVGLQPKPEILRRLASVIA